MMNVGTICYATQSGLGHLAKWFYDNGIINRILILDHPRYQEHKEWYRPEDRFRGVTYKRFMDDLDAIIIFENAFTMWSVAKRAQDRGTKIILIPMYEWTPRLPLKPDYVICPSLLDIEYFNQYPHQFLPIPAPNLPWKERTKAIQFVHNAGHGQVGYAKGTPEVLEAMHYVDSPVKLLVRGQKGEQRIDDLFKLHRGSKNIELVYGDIPYEALFSIGDVYINAERYNGLSLPLQEAYSSGMLVMTTNRFPANTWLPVEPLIPVKSYEDHAVNYTKFKRATIDPIEIAKCIDNWYNKDITEYSHKGREWSEVNSWKNLRPKYLDIIQGVTGKIWKRE